MAKIWAAAEDYLLQMSQPVWIISGFRTREEQRRLGRQGRPTAPDEQSTHRSCPATGVDVAIAFLTSEFQKATWGRIALVNGLRWGGGGPVDPKNGIPLDWAHVDIGPRN